MHTRLKYLWNNMMQKLKTALTLQIGKRGDSSVKASMFSPVFTFCETVPPLFHLPLS